VWNDEQGVTVSNGPTAVLLRNFSLPADASSAKVSAEFKDGVLTVRLGKTEKAKPQQIEVKVA
jgi:HSP20 family molecular chaperone IbpA